MPLTPLQIPSGVFRNGTDMQSAGRWRDASLVRWSNNVMQPVGGWTLRSTITSDPIRGTHAWRDLSGDRFIAAGTANGLFIAPASGTPVAITPTGYTAGNVDATSNRGYSGGTYGTAYYGVQRPEGGTLEDCTSWSVDNWGEYLVACANTDGYIYEWTLNTSNPAAIVSNAPTDNLGILVTEERFIFALGAGGNPRKVQWCDREDNTTWTPAATNEAGDIELQTSGQIETAIRTRGQTLIITDIDAHTARYIGPPYVYGFERVGTSCGIISRQAAADVDMGVFWMGNGGFFRFDGNLVSEIPCDVHDYVFGDINTSQKSKTWAFTNGQFGEIWWFYASSNSTEIDRYVAFDYKENHWLIGNLSRTTGASRGVFEYPMLMDAAGAMYDHEVGLSYAVSGTEQSVFAESGPISIGNGDNIMQVTDLIPDEKTQGDVDVIFKSRYYPNDTEYTHGPYTPSSPTAVRFSGRQIRMRVEGDTPYAAWRVGTMRVDAKAGGRR